MKYSILKDIVILFDYCCGSINEGKESFDRTFQNYDKYYFNIINTFTTILWGLGFASRTQFIFEIDTRSFAIKLTKLTLWA